MLQISDREIYKDFRCHNDGFKKLMSLEKNNNVVGYLSSFAHTKLYRHIDNDRVRKRH
jgi:hypothetical protein